MNRHTPFQCSSVASVVQHSGVKPQIPQIAQMM
jgi:hypothetical protein